VKKRKIVFTVLLALGVVFSLLAEHFSDFVETYYSAGFYYGVIRPYGILIGYLPFSLAEVTVVLSAFYGAYLFIKGMIRFIQSPTAFLKLLPKRMLRMLYLFLALFLTFQLMWGLHYSRKTFSEIAGFTLEDFCETELAELARHLVALANEIRETVLEDDQGVMMLSYEISEMLILLQKLK
jgi:hypothetical protein